jgi:putative Mg2+ transporter-C (MgtC) family protein
MVAAMWSHAEWVLLEHVLLAFALSFAIGFEREIRGAPAGDRTYALVGLAAAAITAVAIERSPQTVAGIVTGIGFVGAGMVFRSDVGMIKNVTSAATLLVVVAIGVVAGSGHSVLAIAITALVIVDLELRHIPVLRLLDSRRYTGRVAGDDVMGGMESRIDG